MVKKRKAKAEKRVRRYKDKLNKPLPASVTHTSLKHVRRECRERYAEVEPCLYDALTRLTKSALVQELEVTQKAKAVYLMKKRYAGEDIAGKCLSYFRELEDPQAFCTELLELIDYLIMTCCSYTEKIEDGVWSELKVTPSRVLINNIISELRLGG